MKIFKKISAAVLAAVVAAAAPLTGAVNNALSVTAKAANAANENDWKWTLLEDGTVKIDYYQGYNKTSVVIPDEINGRKVTSIGAVTNGSVFGQDITEVTIPGSVTNIDANTFAYGYKITAINVDKDNNIFSSEDGVLFNKDKSELIRYPLGNEQTSYTIPDGVVRIGTHAFDRCQNSLNLTIPNSVTDIDIEAFADCGNLSAFNVDKGNTKYCSEDGVLFNKDKTELIRYPSGNEQISYIMPDSVTHIGEYAFNYVKLEDVTISKNIADIHEKAFISYARPVINVDKDNTKYCSEDGIVFNNDKTELILAGKLANTRYTVPDTVTSIANYAFYSGGLREINLPDGLKSIGDKAFFHCSYLTEIIISNSVTSIGVGAFEDCTGLTEVVMSDSVTSISDRIFAGCEKLSKVTIPNSVTSIGNEAFEVCGFAEIEIPDSVTGIGVGAFTWCTALTEVVIPNGIKSIGAHTFEHCENLSKVTIPDSVTSIGESSFESCKKLTEIKLPNDLETIGIKAFCDTGLTEVRIPNGATSVGLWCFIDCPNLEDIYYAGSKSDWYKITEEMNVGGSATVHFDKAESETSNPTTSAPATSEPTTSDPTTNEPTSSEPTTSTGTPGDTDKPAEQETIDATLKNVDSKDGLSGAELEKQIFGDSGYTWEQTEKIEFTSDKLFSVRYTAADGTTKTLGEETTARAEDDGIWNTAWTLDTSLLSKDRPFVKLVAKDGTADITAKVYIKKGAEKPSTDTEKPSNSDQKPTGIALAIAPVVLAAGAVIVISKKRK